MSYDRRGLLGKWVVLDDVAYVPRFMPLYVVIESDGSYIRSTISEQPNIGPFEQLAAAQLALVIIAEAVYAET